MDVNNILITVLHAIIPLIADVLSSPVSSSLLLHSCQRRKRLKWALLANSRRMIPKIDQYISVLNILPNDIFHSHFRMSRSAFEILLQKVSPQLSKCNSGGLQSVDPQKSLLLTLWALSNQCCFRDVADRFGVGRGSAHRIYMQTCKVLCEFVHEFIKWPSSNTDIFNNVSKFNKLRGISSFPGIIGVIDGMHIAIPAPKTDPQSYYNRKNFHSMNLQAICDSEMRFIDLFFGWPGSTHDASVWSNSPIGDALNNRDFNIPTNFHIVGDSAYPLRNFLMRPYKDNGHLTRKQKKFNTKLSSSRVVIEQAFGRLRGKFRRLKYLNMIKLTAVKDVVLAACILHNFIIDNPDKDYNYDSDYSSDSSDSEVYESDDENYVRNRDSQPKSKRDAIADKL